MNDFFDLPEESFSEKKTSGAKKTDESVYDPDPSTAKGGVHKSVIRLIPNLRDQKLSKYLKYTAKIYNPLTKKAVYVDCPSNEGKPSILWDLDKIKRRLYKEEPDLHKKINDNFSRWYTYHSYVYIKKDLQNPGLDDTIKIFKYRAQINEMIEQMINPDEDGLIESAKKVNPFHLLHGRDFVCVVSKKTKTFRDWTKCKFMEDDTPFVFKVGDTEVEMKNDPKAIELATKFFDKNAPSLEDYMHKPWTADTYIEVADAIKAAVPYPEVIKMLIAETKDQRMIELLEGGTQSSSYNSSSSSSNSPIVEDEAFESIDNSADNIDTPVNAAPPTDTTDSSLKEDEYDELFKDM